MNFNLEDLSQQIQSLLAIYGLRVVGALAILVIGTLVAKGIRKAVRGIMNRSHVDNTLVSFTSSIVYVGVLAFVVIAALGKLGIQTASFVAVLATAGLAVGLALQGSLSNFAAGFLMVVFKPFKVGDYVEGAGVAGSVEEVGIFTTELKSPDNKKIIVPNAKIMGDNIVNYSAKEMRRIDLVARVSYQDDLDKVKKVLQEILNNDTRVLQDPAPTIAILELADSGVKFAVRPWVKTSDYWDVFFATQESIKKQFDAQGITIPFPQQDVHIHNR